MKKYTYISLLLSIVALMIPNPIQARESYFSFNISGSKAVSYWDVYLKYGISGGLTILTPVRENIYFGGSLDYTLWNAIDNPKDEDLDAIWVIAGSIHQLGLYPVFRIISPLGRGTVNVFFQIGYGYFLLMSDHSVEDGCGFFEPLPSRPCNVFDSYQISGLQISIGVIEVDSSQYRIELYPSYDILFIEGENLQYLELNLGIMF